MKENIYYKIYVKKNFIKSLLSTKKKKKIISTNPLQQIL